MTRIRPVGLFVIAAATAWAAGHGAAQPPAFPKGPRPVPPLPIPRPAFLDPDPYTAFPDLKLPMTELKGPPGPDGKPLPIPPGPDGKPRMVPDTTKLYERLYALLARPVPADAPPLRKVRIAQVYEGASYVYRFEERLRLGSFAPSEYPNYLKLVAEVYRAAAEVEDTPAGKIALYEDRVLLLQLAERYTEARNRVGTDPPYALNEARFYRIQAEAELLQLKAK